MARYIHVLATVDPDGISKVFAAWEHVGTVKNADIRVVNAGPDKGRKNVELIIELPSNTDASLYAPGSDGTFEM
jgi:hypothetical protein